MGPRLCGDIINLLSSYVTSNYGFLDMNNLISLILIITGLYIFGNVATILSNKVMINVSRDVTFKLRRNIVRKLNRVPINYLDITPTGDIMARLTNDMLTVESLIESDLLNLIVQILTIILVFIMMLFVNPLLTVVYIIILPFAFLITKFITTKTRKQFKKQQSSVGDYLRVHLTNKFNYK